MFYELLPTEYRLLGLFVSPQLFLCNSFSASCGRQRFTRLTKADRYCSQDMPLRFSFSLNRSSSHSLFLSLQKISPRKSCNFFPLLQPTRKSYTVNSKPIRSSASSSCAKFSTHRSLPNTLKSPSFSRYINFDGIPRCAQTSEILDTG